MLLFLAAEGREFAGLLPLCRRVEKLNWPVEWARSGELNGREVVLAANGPGPRLAAEALQVAEGSVDAVVSAGFCGALDPALKIGDVFVAEGIQVGGVVTRVETPQTTRNCIRGTLVSRDRVAQTIEEKRNLRRSGAGAVEMEAAGMLPRVREWEVPFYCIRSVTDLADESFAVDFNAVRNQDGRFSTPRILVAAIRKPFTAGAELMKLQRRCRVAARTLGEFIADCRF
jgi:adenosylhomocysteine nucleosidase